VLQYIVSQTIQDVANQVSNNLQLSVSELSGEQVAMINNAETITSRVQSTMTWQQNILRNV
jgi:hypothetical protein